ncbi:MAG: Na/Pi cotransporter family protein [Clostridia bacterium]|nr:Na/Pi cotransporter family protein [Clostridia bacterium]
MDITITVMKMIGGCILMLYGMNLLSSNLKKIAGEKFENILQRATDNVFKGVLTGILITVALQSSTATTVMVVGFVNAGILKLKNSIPIIMGANIGTTVTAQILRLASLDGSILSFLSPSNIAPILLLIGFILLEMKKKKKARDTGLLLIGIGLLFTGLMMMIEEASNFSNLPILTTILTTLSNPILGVFAGIIITVIVHSSAATVGILQALSTTGFTTFANTIPVILGQNIGTCVTSLVSSIGATKNAKRTAMVHLYFNLIGTILFMIGIYGYQYIVGFAFWNDAIDMGQIANFHLIFNIVSTLVLLPFTGLLEKLTLITIRDKKVDVDEDQDLNEYVASLSLLDERIANIPSIALNNSLNVILKMGELSERNLNRAIKLIDKFDEEKLEHIGQREDAIDKMDIKVANYLVEIGNLELTDTENKSVSALLKIEGDYEKIGDYAFKIAKSIELMKEKELKFSNIADKEIKIMYNIVEDVIVRTHDILTDRKVSTICEIEALRQIADRYKENYKSEHIERLKEGNCTVENGIAFIELLADMDKIINHCINIAVQSLNIVGKEDYVTKHDFMSALSIDKKEDINSNIENFEYKYEHLAEDNKLELSNV